MKSLKIKPGDYVKVLKNGEFHNIVQIKKIYGSCIETSHGIGVPFEDVYPLQTTLF